MRRSSKNPSRANCVNGCARIRLRLLTSEIRGIVCAAAAFVGGDLGIRAQRTRADLLAVFDARGHQMARRLLLLHPLFAAPETDRNGPCLRRRRNGPSPVPCINERRSSRAWRRWSSPRCCSSSPLRVAARQRRSSRRENHLAAARDEFPDVGIDGVHRLVCRLVGERDVRIKIDGPRFIVPVRIFQARST